MYIIIVICCTFLCVVRLSFCQKWLWFCIWFSTYLGRPCALPFQAHGSSCRVVDTVFSIGSFEKRVRCVLWHQCVFSSTGVKWYRMEAACELSVGLHNKPRYFSQLGHTRFSVLLQLTVRWCERYCHACASGGNPFHVVHLFALDVKNAAPHFTWLWMGMTGPCCWPPFCILTVVSRLCFTGSFLEGGGKKYASNLKSIFYFLKISKPK